MSGTINTSKVILRKGLSTKAVSILQTKWILSQSIFIRAINTDFMAL